MGEFFQRQLNLSRAKLKATRETSGLICGFALVLLVSWALLVSQSSIRSAAIGFIIGRAEIFGHVSFHLMVLNRYSRALQLLWVALANVAIVELQLIDRCDPDGPRPEGKCTNLPDGLVIAFSVCVVLMVSVHLLALMISICILPYVDIVVTLGIVDSGGNLNGSKGNLSESPHIKMHGFIEASWIMSNILGLLIFMVFMGLLSWIKFLDYSRNAAVGSTTILVPFLIIFTAFAVHFYYKLVKHKVKSAGKSLNEIAVGLEELQKYGSTYSIQTV